MPQRLKSLELHGYKTFASKTLFEFPGTITAIVGPNGSGKSNIADSLRWVLGEQSFSLLRGRKTEDMIFSGSEQRPRAGMASATITFDNTDGWLPVDYSEVTITRRAYRDGQNEYLLNGQKIRLKDIYELLAKSGLAERTYTIIGQGLVDAALALKPEERRRLFEEAAGIGLYRTRRQEAITRLETTRRNIERAEDIVAEIEPRIQSLERQAKRVADYTRIQEELKVLLKDWYGYHWFRSQNDLTHAREVMRSQEALAQQERQKQKECAENLANFRGKTAAIRTTLNGLHAASSQVHNQRESINKDLAVLEERQNSMSQQFLNLQNNQARIEEEINASQKRLDSIEIEITSLEEELDESKKKANDAQTQLKTREQERSVIQQKLGQARQTQMQKQTQLLRINEQKKDLQNRITTLSNSMGTAETSMENDRKLLEETQQALAGQESRHQDVEQKISDAQTRINELKRKYSDEESSRRKLVDQKSRLDAEQAKIRVQLDVLDQTEKSLTGYPEGAKILLEKIRSGNLKGLKNAISNLIIVPPELETAIAASLGDFMDGVIIDEADPEKALSMVESGKKGRAALLPVSTIQVSEKKMEVNDPACLGRAVDLVKFSEEMQKVLSVLLQDVLVVKTRQDAHRLFDHLTPGGKIVTLDGEVYLFNGTILAGFGAVAGKLSRPRQRQEFEEQLGKLAGEIHALEEAVAAGSQKIRSIEEEQAASTKEEARLRTELDLVNRERQKESLNVEKLKRQIDWQQTQLNTNLQEVEKAKSQLKSAAEQVKTLDEELLELEKTIRENQQALSHLPLEELQNELSHWRTNQAVTTRAMTDAVSRRDEASRNIGQNRIRLSSSQGKFKELETLKETLEQEKLKLKDQEVVLSKKLDEVRAEIDPMELELHAAEQEYESLQAVESSVNQNLTITERHFAQAQLDYTRQNEGIDNLKRKIEEDFGLVAYEYAENVTGQSPLPIEGMVEQLPSLPELPKGLEESISRLKTQLRRIGAINPEAQAEYQETKERFEFMTGQIQDLKKADDDLKKVIVELDTLMKQGFNRTFTAVSAEFPGIFKRLFEGGSARLVLTDPDDPTETGIEIEAKLPGRREQGLSLLSGGERSLTAAALIFALLKVAPTPFCVMDEVDAMLDESNVGRYRDMLKELSETIQFIVVTHNRNTVQAADVIYGVTMGRDSASQVISLKLDEISEDMVKG
jgi:chromosome segregation protein